MGGMMKVKLALLQQVQAPVRVVRGERSAVMPRDPALELAHAAGTELVELPGLCHHLPLEAPEAVAGLITGLLGEVRLQAGPGARRRGPAPA